jgi:hypothetical protein
VLRTLLADPRLTSEQRGELRASLGMLVLRYDVAGLADLQAALPDLAHRPDLYARALSTLSIPRLTSASVSEQLAWSEQALTAALGQDDAEARIAVLVDGTALLGGVGDPRFRPALEALPRPGSGPAQDRQLLRAAINAVDSLSGLGHYDEAQRWAERADRLFAEVAHERDSYLGFGFGVYRLVLRWVRGEWAGLREDVTGMLERGPTHGLLEHLRGRLLAAGGEPLVTLEPALAVVRRKGAWTWAAEVAVPATEALLATGRGAQAARFVADLVSTTGTRPPPWRRFRTRRPGPPPPTATSSPP